MGHSARSLFEKNIQSAKDCYALWDSLNRLQPNLDIDWLLRAGVVFVVSALDAYFHDKVRYRVAKVVAESEKKKSKKAKKARARGRPAKDKAWPKALQGFRVPLGEVYEKWEKAERKGNVVRNWVNDVLGYKPLQRPDDVADALKYVGIEKFWVTLAGGKETDKKAFLAQYNRLLKRRHQIAHEGDRRQYRSSGRQLRPIGDDYLNEAVLFAEGLVACIEHHFPG